MSSTKIPTHVVVIPNKVLVPMAWRKEYGPPTVDNLIKYVAKFDESLKPGGCNAHFAEEFSSGCVQGMVKIVHQRTGNVVVSCLF